MNAHSKIHQASLETWAVRIADQANSGLTIREWCRQNNLSIHKYNYWKHLLKEEVTDQIIPDIVPLPMPESVPAALPSTLPIRSQHMSCKSHDSYNSCYTSPTKTISVSIGDVSISISSDMIFMLPDIIRVVRYA